MGFCILGCLFSPCLAYSRKVGAVFTFLDNFMVGSYKTLTKENASHRIVSTSRKRLMSCLKLHWYMDDKFQNIRIIVAL